ncbi:hypothetical protein PENTCL1PPCAC_13752, partial [Pristionchus entomophagus]
IRLQIPPEKGMLLHNRVQFREDQLEGVVETKFSDLNMTLIEQRARETSLNIFGDIIPSHNAHVSYVMDKCDASWRSHGCKVPLLHCKKDLIEVDEWIFPGPADDSHYTMF